MRPEDKQQYLDMIPRVFVRALRDPHGNEEFELSEGEATDLLRRREEACAALGWRLWRAVSQAEDYLGICANVPELGDAMNAWKAHVPDPNRLPAAQSPDVSSREVK